ncbi:hypothetical protein GCM10017600_16040 [Streptosporangium carneum]|uniref:Uncharacterized protein n=1 Tax=Streptosporangium carneum TaxID=47481 RepID=A0A9W6MBD5_9ACTN|nr:hypothetical protein GCM10017600_16040 [Streptosporangium carneum]
MAENVTEAGQGPVYFTGDDCTPVTLTVGTAACAGVASRPADNEKAATAVNAVRHRDPENICCVTLSACTVSPHSVPAETWDRLVNR